MRKPELSEKDNRDFNVILSLIKGNESAIEYLQKKGDDIKNKLIQFCPYKVGNIIQFKLKYSDKIRQGRIERIGYDEEGIDGLWNIQARPLAKDLSKLKRVVVYAQNLGEDDKIIKIIS